MAKPLRHRQTKEAETDMPSLTPPRHIPTLPIVAESAPPASRPLSRTAALAGTRHNGRRAADGIDDKELLGFEVEEFN
jgi:hypothetical protein